MSETKFTPGPWALDPDLPRDVMTACGEERELIATAYPMGRQECEDGGGPIARANARLIAAAPDLYTALERLVETTHQTAVARGEESMAVRMARIHATAALAKARGAA